MMYSLVAALGFAAVAQAQSACLASAAAIPPCALGYLASAASAIGGCGIVDFQCQCSNSQAVQASIQQTVLSQCGNSAVDVINSAGALCSCASANSGQSIMLSGAASACEASAAAIPACALGYIADAASAIGGCAIDDFACQCSNSAAVQSSIQNTILSQCGGSAADVIESAGAVCSCLASNGGGSSGGSGSMAATTTGGASMAATGAMSGSKATGAASATAGTGSKATSMAVSAFTGGAATTSAFGGVFAAVLGLIAAL